MPAISSLLVGPLLQVFFTEYLSQHKQVSHQTIVSYRDTFRLLLQYVRDTYSIEPAKLRISELDAPVILAFLAYLEQARGNKVRSRNQRLAAIRAFFRVVALRDPASVGIATRIMAIPMKRCDKRLVGYLSREEIDAIVSVPDRLTWRGRRDHALHLKMYNIYRFLP
jgi:integrase/recombinase XerD